MLKKKTLDLVNEFLDAHEQHEVDVTFMSREREARFRSGVRIHHHTELDPDRIVRVHFSFHNGEDWMGETVHEYVDYADKYVAAWLKKNRRRWER